MRRVAYRHQSGVGAVAHRHGCHRQVGPVTWQAAALASIRVPARCGHLLWASPSRSEAEHQWARPVGRAAELSSLATVLKPIPVTDWFSTLAAQPEQRR